MDTKTEKRLVELSAELDAMRLFLLAVVSVPSPLCRTKKQVQEYKEAVGYRVGLLATHSPTATQEAILKLLDEFRELPM